MNRNALLIYLHDLRDLEAARYQIEKMRRNNLAANKSATGKIQSEISAINTANYMGKPDRPEAFSLIMFICGLVCIFGSFLWSWLGIPLIDKYCMIIGILASVAFGIMCFLEYKGYIKAKGHKNLQKSLESQQRTEQNTLEAAQYASICATYSKTTAFFSTANYLSKGNAW